MTIRTLRHRSNAWKSLYRPALERGLPINLATIPDVSLNACNEHGHLEGFLRFKNGHAGSALPIGSNTKLITYLKENSPYEILQHGLHHDYLEFERLGSDQTPKTIERGTNLLLEAGFERPQTFVAPYDKFSRVNLREVAKRFRIISTGWFELGRLPRVWWPRYALKKLRHTPHWRAGNTLLLSHPGCLLSCFRSANTSRDLILQNIKSNRLTVLVTHWWEVLSRMALPTISSSLSFMKPWTSSPAILKLRSSASLTCSGTKSL